MITIMVFAKGAYSTLKQLSEVTVKGVLKTTTDGVVSFDLPHPGTYNTIVKSKGYQSFQGDLVFGKTMNLVDVTLTPEVPAPEGYTGYCTISSYDCVAGTCYKVVHPDHGTIMSGYTEYRKAQDKAHDNERCFERAPAEPTLEETISAKVITKVQGMIEIVLTAALTPIQNTLNGIPSMISSMIADALAPITASIDALKAWTSKGLTDMYVNIESTLITPLHAHFAALYGDLGNIWTSIEDMVEAAEQEVTARVTAITTLDKTLRAWITDSVFELLMKKLDEGAKDVRGK